MEDGRFVEGSLYFYAPNKGAPVVFAILFAISGLWHVYQCIHYKCWKVSGILPWAATIFVGGYIMREIGAFNYGNIDVFISSIVLLYAAPPLYELANYFILSRILYYVPYHSPIHPGRVLTTFAALSSVVEALNANGAAYTANTSLPEKKQSTGRSLLKSALILQLVILGLFLLLAGSFHRKCVKAKLFPSNLRAVLTTLYISTSLICVRTIFRTVEYFSTASLHFDSELRESDVSIILRYEWWFWVFEAALMICNTFLLNARHPLRFLPRNNKIYLGEDGLTEIQGEGYEDRRPFLVTFFDPFDIAGLLQGRNLNQRFWETHAAERTELPSRAGTADAHESERERKSGVVVESV
ncbi:Protein RTA1-like protein 6 [Phlyctema vagabunda]|uniref:Protein RTA1-like protein 6 n=1 Tax=Phlyctema vagabunda TaxID=108571 RepID=A0ABR4PSM9_9HELO